MANTKTKKFNNNKKNNRPERIVREFYLNAGNSTGSREYDRDTLLQILNEVPFNKISIPVNLHKYYTTGDAEAKGYLNVGYVIGYNAEEEKFSVVIKNNFAETVDGMTDTIIFARASVNKDGEVKNIIALDIECAASEEENSEVEAETTEE